MKTRRTHSHIHKASLAAIMIIVPRYLRDVGELQDLTRGIVITGEIYHLRSTLPSPLSLFLPGYLLPSFFFVSFFLFLHSACRYALRDACVLCIRAMLHSVAAFSFSPPSLIRRMRDANGRLSRIPRHPQSRFARNYFSPCCDLFMNDGGAAGKVLPGSEEGFRETTWERRRSLSLPPCAIHINPLAARS